MTKEQIVTFGIQPKTLDDLDTKIDCIIITVAHDEFKKIKLDSLNKVMSEKPVLIDVRGMFQHEKDKNEIVYRTL